jgi:eukaryotic-like serine/threonine-protein kinase
MGEAPIRVVGRYALYGEIAAGGMATVHFGRLLGPVGFSRTVAIKRLHPQFAKDPEFVSMFLDEARVAARIQHPNVVATLDVVALEGELFLVMEYVEGESLARILRTMRGAHSRIPPRMVGSIITNVLYGLHAAHEAKSERGEPLHIIHRDVSPQNVLVGIDGTARVLDFGVAKAAGRIQTTRDGQIKGKLAYMPVEQIAGENVDRRADVYAASVVLWEALTSQRLFDGGNEGAILHKIMTGQVIPPSAVIPDLPPGIDEVVLRGLARDPNQRFATAYDMAVALEDVLGVESPRRVGALVVDCASDTIARRAAHVKEIESMPTDLEALGGAARVAAMAGEALGRAPSAPLIVPAPGETSSLSKVSSAVVSGYPPQPRRSRAFVGVGIGLFASLAVIALVALTLRASPEQGSVGARAPASGASPMLPPASAAPASGAASLATADPAAPPTSSLAPSASVSGVARAKTVPETRPTALRPTATTTAPRPPPTHQVAPKAQCNPPYYFEGGIRKIKRECL